MAAPKASGFKLSLASAKNKPGLKPGIKAPTQNPAKRPRLDLGDDEPDHGPRQQHIVGWDAAEGGAVDVNGKKEEKGPLVIPSLPNSDRLAGARKKQAQRNGAPPGQNGQNGQTPQNGEGSKQSEVTWGLTVPEKRAEETSASPEAMDTSEDTKPDDGLTEEQRLEKNAMHALLHGKPLSEQTTIPVQTEEAYQHDIHSAPEAPTLAAYEAVPIEGFGAALLRGMGWKDGEELGRAKNSKEPKPKEIKRRPALLGIGAKDEVAAGIELGEWGKGQKSKVRQSYNPVTLKNKITGEMITEDELKKKLEAQKLVPEGKEKEKASRSSGKYDDYERSDRRKEKRRDDDYDSERRRDKDRDRREDRKREKRRDRDDEYCDSERRREKKYRDDDYDSERRREKRRDRDRDRSRSPDSDDRRREKRRERERRDRDRSRSRDSDDRRKRRREYEYEDERDERKRRYKEKY